MATVAKKSPSSFCFGLHLASEGNNGTELWCCPQKTRVSPSQWLSLACTKWERCILALMCISWKVAQLPQSERGATQHLQHNISWIQVMEVYHETELLFGLGWVGPFQAILPNGAFFQARNSGASLTEKVKPLVKFNIPTYPNWQLVEHGRKTCVFFMVFIHKTREFPLRWE